MRQEFNKKVVYNTTGEDGTGVKKIVIEIETWYETPILDELCKKLESEVTILNELLDLDNNGK
ncbi:MAG: hypothetical protein ACTSQF_01960 [Candidatus Heimdallarchaeaceae archaeon]